MKKIFAALMLCLVFVQPSHAFGGWFGQVFNDPLRATRNLLGNHANNNGGGTFCTASGGGIDVAFEQFLARQSEQYNVQFSYNFTDLYAPNSSLRMYLNDAEVWAKIWGGSGTVSLPIITSSGTNTLRWTTDAFNTSVSCVKYDVVNTPSFQPSTVTNVSVLPATVPSVPEPSTVTLFLAGIALLAFRVWQVNK